MAKKKLNVKSSYLDKVTDSLGLSSLTTEGSKNDLFNETSRNLIKDFDRYSKDLITRKISITAIHPNNLNEFSIDAIDSLANSIKENGLQQNLVVRKVFETEVGQTDPIGQEIKKDHYILIAGERRLTALRRLFFDENLTFFGMIECAIKNFDDIPLNMPVHIYEKRQISQTNQSGRELTLYDRMLCVESAFNYHNFVRTQNREQQIPSDQDPYYGLTTRKMVSKEIGWSETKIHFLLQLVKDLSPEFKGIIKLFPDFKQDVALALCALTTDEQLQFLATIYDLEENFDFSTLAESTVKDFRIKLDRKKTIELNETVNNTSNLEEIPNDPVLKDVQNIKNDNDVNSGTSDENTENPFVVDDALTNCEPILSEHIQNNSNKPESEADKEETLADKEDAIADEAVKKESEITPDQTNLNEEDIKFLSKLNFNTAISVLPGRTYKDFNKLKKRITQDLNDLMTIFGLSTNDTDEYL